MRILIIPSWYPTPARLLNGIFVRAQADALSRAHEVRVLYLDVLPRGMRRKPRRRLSRERGYLEEVVEIPNRPLVWQFAYLWKLYRALKRARAEFAPDLIHAHVAVPAGWGAAMLRGFLGAPLVLTEHSGQPRIFTARPGLRWMARRAYRSADLIIAVGPGQKERLLHSFPGLAHVVVIPNAVDISLFQPSPLPAVANGYRLLFVGLLESPVKGLDVLLNALALLKERSTLPLYVDVIGDGALRGGYEEAAHNLGLDDTVSFMGTQPHELIARKLRESHALVLPSLSEAAPLVIIEALASGRPVISTRCGGPEYMIDNTNGLIVEPGQAGQLAEAIADLLANLDRYDPQRVARAAQSKYSYEAVAAALTRVYGALVKDR